MLGPVCPLPLIRRAGVWVLDASTELRANGHRHHGESPGLGHRALDYGSHSALTCYVIQSPVLSLSVLQLPQLRNSLALGEWELKSEACLIEFLSSCSLRLHQDTCDGLCAWCVWGEEWLERVVLGPQNQPSGLFFPFSAHPVSMVPGKAM